MNIKRLYVHDKIYDAFLTALVAFVRDNMPHGPASDPATAIGPVQVHMLLPDFYRLLCPLLHPSC